MQAEDPYEAEDRKFHLFRRSNPDVSFAAFTMGRVARRMTKGAFVHAGGALEIPVGDPENFWVAAEPKARKWIKTMSLQPGHRLIEYGCGSLRLGAHFIRHLDPGDYFGLDVIDGFFAFGKQAMGASLVEAKRPQLHVIDEASIALGTDFAADFVCSNTVCVHVHPDEIDAYLRNLARLTAKPGARLIFNAVVARQPHRFEFNSWARPLEFYRQALSALEFVRADIGRLKLKDEVGMNLIEFEFRR